MQHQRVTLLHLSDISWDRDQRVVFDAFFEDIRTFAANGIKSDLIILSGDVVSDGDDYDSFSLVLDKIIQPLIQETSLDESRFFIVPGNHDVQRTVISNELITQEGLESRLINREKLNEFYENNSNYAYVRQKLTHFIVLKECLGN